MFNTRAFLEDKFRSPKGLAAFLRAYNVEPPSDPAIEKWFLRETIPGSWLPLLLAYLEVEEGKPPSLTPYLQVRNENEGS